MKSLYAKIYTEENDVLVLEGQGDEVVPDVYYPTGGSRISTVVIGAQHVSITPEAKDLFKAIVKAAPKTGDDLSCLDIHTSAKGICVSWLGETTQRLQLAGIENTGFWIGCGEGAPHLHLLDELATPDVA